MSELIPVSATGFGVLVGSAAAVTGGVTGSDS